MNEDVYYSIKDVSTIFKVTYLTVYRWVQAKRLVAVKAGKQYRISKSEIERFTKFK